jgi:hypothetical protein
LGTWLGCRDSPTQGWTSLYHSEGFGGDQTLRAKVIGELIDESKVLRRQLSEVEARSEGSEVQ